MAHEQPAEGGLRHEGLVEALPFEERDPRGLGCGAEQEVAVEVRGLQTRGRHRLDQALDEGSRLIRVRWSGGERGYGPEGEAQEEERKKYGTE
jgi:hypothetical protein